MHQRTRDSSIVMLCGVMLSAAASIEYPRARQDDTVDVDFGTKVANPYRWLEDLNSAEVT